MRFSAATLLRVALCASTINALAVSQVDVDTNDERAAASDDASSVEAALAARADLPPSGFLSGADGTFVVEPAPEGQDTEALQKRIAPALLILSGPIINAVAAITTTAIEAAFASLVSMIFWDQVREKFTLDATKRMWDHNPDHRRYPAAICHNNDYRLRDPTRINGLVKIKLSLGLLFTDYDCMFMETNNEFISSGDGGYINRVYYHDNRCTYYPHNGNLLC